MLLPVLNPYRYRRGWQRPRRQPPVPPAPPGALVLVSAEFDGEGVPAPWVLLGFSRPVDLASVNPGDLSVDDAAETGERWIGVMAEAAGPAGVRVFMEETGAATGTQTLLTATANTGIIAADDGSPWAGVTDLELPYP